MKPDTWMPLYIGDYLGDTAGLSHAEHGAYLLCLMAYWRKGGPLGDREALSIAGEEWPHIKRFFAADGKRWRHKRVDAELAKAGRVYEKRCQAAAAGGQANRRAWESRKDSHTASHTASHTDTVTVAQSQSQPQVTSNKKKQHPAAVAAEFASVWQAYPRKAGKSKSARLCARLVKSGLATWEQLQAAAAGYARECRSKATEERFIKHGPTFYGPGNHWRDYLTGPEQQTGQPALPALAPFGHSAGIAPDPMPDGWKLPDNAKASHYPDGKLVTAWYGDGTPVPRQKGV